VAGKSKAINKINQRNRIEIVATGAELRAIVNGKEVAKVADSNPGAPSGAARSASRSAAGRRRRTRRSSRRSGG
jgi:hypothetical protein